MDLYKRKSDNKTFHIVKVVEIFVGMISWYDGPRYEKEYTLTSVPSDGSADIVTRDLHIFDMLIQIVI